MRSDQYTNNKKTEQKEGSWAEIDIPAPNPEVDLDFRQVNLFQQGLDKLVGEYKRGLLNTTAFYVDEVEMNKKPRVIPQIALISYLLVCNISTGTDFWIVVMIAFCFACGNLLLCFVLSLFDIDYANYPETTQVKMLEVSFGKDELSYYEYENDWVVNKKQVLYRSIKTIWKNEYGLNINIYHQGRYQDILIPATIEDYSTMETFLKELVKYNYYQQAKIKDVI